MTSNRAVYLALSVCLLSATWVAKAEDKVKPLTKTEGELHRIEYEDGREITFKLRQKFSPLHSVVTLSDNSCTKALGIRAKYKIPLIQRSLIPVWSKHPTKQGQLVLDYDSEEKKNMVKSLTASVTAMAGERYQKLFKAISDSENMDRDAYEIQAKMSNVLGWIHCEGNCDTLLPKNNEIRFWDENFENPNQQLRMTEDRDGATVNQMTSRLQEISLQRMGRTIFFGVPRKSFGALSSFLAPGVTYQLQWTFQADNIVEPDDDLCQLKWDMDFTQMFTQLQNAQTVVTDPAVVKIEGLPDYLYNAEDEEDLTLNSAFSASTWEFLKEKP